MFYKVTMVWWAKATSDLSETISFASQQLVSSCHGFHNHRRQQLRQLFKQSCYYSITTTLVLLSREDSWGQTASPGAPVILQPVILDSRENSHAIPNKRFALMVGAVSVIDKNEMPFSIKKQQQAWGRIFFILEKSVIAGKLPIYPIIYLSDQTVYLPEFALKVWIEAPEFFHIFHCWNAFYHIGLPSNGPKPMIIKWACL